MRGFGLGLALWTFTSLALVGCGGGNTGPKLYAVSGKLVSGGTPIANATVTFNPVEANMPASSGVTDDDGKFTLATGQAHAGAVAGKHKVTVSPPVNADAYSAPGQDPRAGSSVVPSTFLTTQTTPKEVTVDPKGKNDFTIDVGQ